MDLFAFELAPPYEADKLVGATVAYGPLATTFDLKDALVKGNGTIVTNDPELIATLRGSEILQSSDVPEGATPVEPPAGYIQQETQPPVYFPQEPLKMGAIVDEAAVHAAEPETVEEAAEQPAGQTGTPPSEEETAPTDPDTDQPPSGLMGRRPTRSE